VIQPDILNQFEAGQRDTIKRAHSFIGSLMGIGGYKPAAVIQAILDRADIKAYYEVEEEGDGDNDAIENINELYKIASRFERVSEALDFARKAIAASRRSKKPRLTLSTVHQAKGKEWDHVFVAGVCKDILPHKRGEMGEEKRIMWVAVTRAAKTLTVTFHGTISPFLEGLPIAVPEAAVVGFKGQPTLFEGMV
jgi:superfamily I DNA/RNA helicase